MSASKRPSLAETMQKVTRMSAAPAAEAPGEPPNTEARRGFYAATRAGKKKITATVDPSSHMQFRQLALELGKKGEALLIEALNDLFIKHGKPPIA
jgi:hypothetical protein